MAVVNIDAIKTKALLAVIKPDMAASMRRIFRWYSKSFATPLHLIESLPLEDVLQAYFEDHFGNLEEPILEQEIAEMSLKPADRAAVEKAQEQADDDFANQIAAQVREAESKLAAGKPDRLKDVSIKFEDPNLMGDLSEMDPLGQTTRKP
jgi:hypothetical protein